MGSEAEKEAKAVNKQGDKLYKQKLYSDAIKLYAESVRLMRDAGNTKGAQKFQKELDNAVGKRSEEINTNGDKLFKEKNYEKAIEAYDNAYTILQKAGEQWIKKKGKEFQKELNKCKVAYAKQLQNSAEKLAKEKKWQEAIDLYKEVRSYVNKGVDKKLYTKFLHDSKEVYEKWAEEVNSKGDKLYKEKNFDDAVITYAKSVQLMEKSNNEKKIKNFKKELGKAFEEHAQEINNLGDKLFKEKKYQKAAELYSQSVNIATESSNKKLVDNFSKEMMRAYEKYAEEINNQGDKLFKEKKYEQAAKIYEESVELANDSKKSSLIKNFQKEYFKALEKWAAEVNEEGDAALKEKAFDKAMQFYKQSLEIITKSKNADKIANYTKEYKKACLKLAKEINSDGDAAYKADDYEKAYNLYEKSIKLASIAGDQGKIKAFSKERNKALKKLNG